MSSATSSYEINTDQLPLTELTTWCSKNDPPTRTTILQLRRQCTQIGSAIPCLWYGEFGIAGYFATPAQWRSITGIPNAVFHPIPVPPNQMPALPAGATAAQRTQARDDYNFHVASYTIATKGINFIMKLIRQAGTSEYMHGIFDRNTGFARVTPAQLFTTLITTYGRITTQERQALRDAFFNIKYHGGPPEVLIAAMDDAADNLADENIAVNDDERTDVFISAITASGTLRDALRDWAKLPAADQTWQRARQMIIEGYKFDQAQTTAGAAGYANGAAVPTSNTPDAPDLIVEGLATSQNIIANLTSQAREDHDTIVKLKEEVERLRKTNATLQARINGKRTGRDDEKYNDDGTPKYCHTHGFGNHNGCDCKNPGTGHKNEATAANKMGGSTRRYNTRRND